MSDHLCELVYITLNRIDGGLVLIQAPVDVEHLPWQAGSDFLFCLCLFLRRLQQRCVFFPHCHPVLRACSARGHELGWSCPRELRGARSGSLGRGNKEGILRPNQGDWATFEGRAAAMGKKRYNSLGEGKLMIPIVRILLDRRMRRSWITANQQENWKENYI